MAASNAPPGEWLAVEWSRPASQQQQWRRLHCAFTVARASKRRKARPSLTEQASGELGRQSIAIAIGGGGVGVGGHLFAYSAAKRSVAATFNRISPLELAFGVRNARRQRRRQQLAAAAVSAAVLVAVAVAVVS